MKATQSTQTNGFVVSVIPRGDGWFEVAVLNPAGDFVALSKYDDVDIVDHDGLSDVIRRANVLPIPFV